MEAEVFGSLYSIIKKKQQQCKQTSAKFISISDIWGLYLAADGKQETH